MANSPPGVIPARTCRKLFAWKRAPAVPDALEHHLRVIGRNRIAAVVAVTGCERVKRHVHVAVEPADGALEPGAPQRIIEVGDTASAQPAAPHSSSRRSSRRVADSLPAAASSRYGQTSPPPCHVPPALRQRAAAA